MAKLWCAPTGKISKGGVLDCAQRPLDRALRDYDPQLYTQWNAKKNKGWGTWEIRRKPNTKRVVDITEFQGVSYVTIDWAELDIENHVLDLECLNYEALTKVKSMDTWNHNRQFFVDQLESNERSYDEKIKAQAREDMLYRAKQYRTQINEFKQMVLSGVNPGRISEYWEK